MIRTIMNRARSELHSLSALRQASQSNPGAKIEKGVRILGSPSRLRIGTGAEIDEGATLDFRFGGTIILGPNVKIYGGAILAPFGGHITIGEGSGVNHYSVLYGHGGLTIGKYVRFAAHCLVIPANHGFDDRSQPIHSQPLSMKGIRMGDDIWVGGQSTILDGVTVGDGSVIAAGSVVSRDIGSYVVAAGVPAKFVRER